LWRRRPWNQRAFGTRRGCEENSCAPAGTQFAQEEVPGVPDEKENRREVVRWRPHESRRARGKVLCSPDESQIVRGEVPRTSDGSQIGRGKTPGGGFESRARCVETRREQRVSRCVSTCWMGSPAGFKQQRRVRAEPLAVRSKAGRRPWSQVTSCRSASLPAWAAGQTWPARGSLSAALRGRASSLPRPLCRRRSCRTWR
jgi:hypothetical protein